MVRQDTRGRPARKLNHRLLVRDLHPVRDDLPTSDFYVTGSATYPSEDWLFSDEWKPSGRYAHSASQGQIYHLAQPDGPETLALADYLMTFAHAGASVNILLANLDRRALLGGAERRGFGVGHDSGDAIFLGELSASGFDRSASDWF